MKRSGPLPALVGGTLVVATLATWLVKDGWLMWIPSPWRSPPPAAPGIS